jgi:hypothetical protein
MIGDLVRIFCVSLFVALLAYLVQPWLFRSGIIPLSDLQFVDGDIERWLGERYTIGVSIVVVTSLLTTLLWYLITSRSKGTQPGDVAGMRPLWGFLLLLPVLSIVAALYFFNGSNDALLWLTALYVINASIGYWLATILGSPGLFKFVPPLAYLVRRNLLRLK